MAESQSRYSIVERLTNKKLGFLDENSRFDREIEQKVQELVSYEREYASWEQEALADIERTKKIRENNIEKIRAEIEFLKGSKNSKVETIAVKLGEVDKALERLETISKSANEQ